MANLRLLKGSLISRIETIWSITCAAVIGALLLWNAATMLYMMWIGSSQVPFGDQWDTSLLPDESTRNLFALHNEHRPALSRLLGWLDWYVSDARNGATMTFIALCYPAFGLALFQLIKTIVGDWRRAAVFAALATATVVSAAQWENLLWGFESSFVGSFASALIALLFATLAARQPQSVIARVIAVIVCLITSWMAVFSLASGLFSLLFVTALLFVVGAPAKLKYGYTIFAAATLAFYLHGYSSPGYHANPIVSLFHARTVIHFVFAYIGAPFAHGRENVATIIGMFGLLLLAIVVINSAIAFRRNQSLFRTPVGTAYVALLLFVLFIVFADGLTALGRINFGIEQALSSRYATPALMFWAALVSIYLVQPYMINSIVSRWIRLGGALLGLALAAKVAMAQQQYYPIARNLHAEKFKAAIAYVVGLRTHPAIISIYNILPALEEGHLDAPMQRLRADHKSIFAQEWPFKLGAPLSQWKSEHREGCLGYIDDRAIVIDKNAQAEGTPIAEVRGWAWDKVREEAPDLVVFTNDRDIIVGFAGLGAARPDVQHAQSSVTTEYAGWEGFVRADAATALRAYGVFLDGSERGCQFAMSPARS
jgi:hypothetical protein